MADDKKAPPPPAPKPEPVTAKPVDEGDKWSEPKRSPEGYQLHADGLPLTGVARAMALAAKGVATDPEGIVSDEAIAAHDPKAAKADREAVAKFHEQEAAKAADDAAAANAPADQQKGE